MKKSPLVVICGRVNVGKSTLFNRLVGRRKAIVSEIPGTTRDRLYDTVLWSGQEFILVDTGGISFDEKVDYEKDIISQAEDALKTADLILFLVDVKEGLLPSDQKALAKIRGSGKKVILAVNKVENQKLRSQAENLAALGLGRPIAISALHGTSTGDLLDEVVSQLKVYPVKSPTCRDAKQFNRVNKVFKAKSKEEELTKIAICGRPNVGKSSLFNKLIGKRRAIVSEIPGTTRDVINTEVTINEKKYLFLDTAGLRRRTKIKKKIEYYSVLRALRAIEEADIILFMIDAGESIARQDLHIISYLLEKGRGLVLLINKWDLAEVKSEKLKARSITIPDYIFYLQDKMPFLSWVPVVFISAKTGKNIRKVPEIIEQVRKEREKRVKIKELNNLISEAVLKRSPPCTKKGTGKIFYTTQAKGIPPAFVLFVNKKELFRKSYLNYLENRIREKFGFAGTPIKIILRSKSPH